MVERRVRLIVDDQEHVVTGVGAEMLVLLLLRARHFPPSWNGRVRITRHRRGAIRIHVDGYGAVDDKLEEAG